MREQGDSCELWLIRHGETDWSRTGQHTGRTDLALTGLGEQEARSLAPVLAQERFDRVLVSPRQRARQTAQLAGLEGAEVLEDLQEWDYGEYEGKTKAEILALAPGWMLWNHGVPGGETPAEVAARAERVIGRARQIGGQVALFGHGHILRAITVRALGLPMAFGDRLGLGTASIGRILFEPGEGAELVAWNQREHVLSIVRSPAPGTS